METPGWFQVIDLANDYYLVQFEKMKDYARALADGPWTIQGSYLTVQTWQPGFDASREPTKTVVWVQIPKLPVECYRQDILNALAQQIGKPIRIDINTLHVERAKFARLAIEVEFTKPLLGRVEIEGRWFEVCYEDIPDFCFLYGMVPLEQVAATVRPLEAHAKPDTSKFGLWMRVSRQPRSTANRNVSKGSAMKIVAIPFDLGSATALLSEVMRDAADVPSSSTIAPTGSVVFSAPPIQPLQPEPKRKSVGKSKKSSSGEGKVLGSVSKMNTSTVSMAENGKGQVCVGAINLDKFKKALSYPKSMQSHVKPVVASVGVSNSDDVMEGLEESSACELPSLKHTTRGCENYGWCLCQWE
ncbi:hypothetical protein Tsubulata_003729 [Turnera subulata]|uniref:DUF4283 domain-containing protein n=1 Tax=Turnera subulata TaxID=218843 RepID=A0A9Q0GH85_9ROSI|nr:hypothetical protein Tsubulata_003729 [Turnera subulata]